MTAVASPSEYQVAIFEAVNNAVKALLAGQKPNSILVQAQPGSGKTTTGCVAAHTIPNAISAIFVAFNKKIATELSTKLPPNVPARTMHAFWLKQWGSYIRNRHGCNVQINNFKVRNAVEKQFKITKFNRGPRKNATREQLRAHRRKLDLINDVVFLVEKAKLFGVVPKGFDAASVWPGDDKSFWEYAIDYFGYTIDPQHFDVAIAAARLVLVEQLQNETEIDYLDMLYLPAINRVRNEQFQIVMIDEAQDMNALQRHLLSRMVVPNGMLFAVGDRNQAIFSFLGSDTESMNRIKEDFDCVEYPLSISYRCARRIVAEAKQIFPEIEAAPNAPEGSVERPETWNTTDFRPGDLIICRNNAPTINLAYRLIYNKIPAKVLGRDIGQGLIRLIKTLDEDGSLAELIENLRNWRDRQLILSEKKQPDNEQEKERIRDKYECIANLGMSCEINTVPDLIAFLEQLFVDGSDQQDVSSTQVNLSTIHKIKGGQADTVFILDPHLISPPWIRNERQQQQEINLLFVARTRAKNRLVYINSETIKSK